MVDRTRRNPDPMPPADKPRGNGDRPSGLGRFFGRKPAAEPAKPEPKAEPKSKLTIEVGEKSKRSKAVPTELDGLTRTDINLIAQAAREEWLFTPAERQDLLGQLKGIAKNSKYDRNRIAAAKAIALLLGLNVRQQALDLAKEKHRGDDSTFVLASIVAEAERIALEHKPAERPEGT
jgi:hypothetical protein